MISRFAFFIAFFILFDSVSYANGNMPISTPVEFKGLDTLSKFYRPEIKKEKKKQADQLLSNYITDPRVLFSSFFGGNGYDCLMSCATDWNENIYFVGYSGSTNMQTTEGAYQKEKSGGHDAIVAKFTKEGKAVWITYLGGNGTDVALDCITDDNGNLILTGKSNSTNFPVTDGSTAHGSADIFITKFNPDGDMIWSKMYGDTAFEAPEAIAKTPENGFVIGGYTSSPGLPATEGSFQKEFAGWKVDGFFAKFDNDCNIVWWSYIGSNQYEAVHGIAVNSTGDIALTGETKFDLDYIGKKKFPVTDNAFQKDTTGKEDIFLSVFDANGQMKWSTLYGGRQMDLGHDVKFDLEGRVILGGYTHSDDFPVTPDAYKKIYDSHDIIVAKFYGNGDRLWSTFYGGESAEDVESMCISEDNSIWLTGYTLGGDFPTTDDAIFKTAASGNGIMYIAKLNSSGYPLWASFYYGGGLEFSYKILAHNKRFILAGEEGGRYFPVTHGAYQEKVAPLPSKYDGCFVSVDLEHTDVQEIKDEDIRISISESYINVFTDDAAEVIRSIRITDILGRRLFIGTYENQNNIIIPLEELNIIHTLYFLEITTNQKTLIHKFIY